MSDEGVEQPAPRRRRGFESAGDMVRSLTVVLVIVLVVVALNLRQDPDSPVRRFDYSVALRYKFAFIAALARRYSDTGSSRAVETRFLLGFAFGRAYSESETSR